MDDGFGLYSGNQMDIEKDFVMTWGELKEKLAVMGVSDDDYISEITLQSLENYIFIKATMKGALAVKGKTGWCIREIKISSTPFMDDVKIQTQTEMEAPIAIKKKGRPRMVAADEENELA